jgi:uncharacterized membrane protein
MDPTGNIDTINTRSSRPTQIFIASIIGAQLLIALLSYPFLPDIVPTHWNAAGQVNGYGPKWMGTFLFPAFSLGIYILVHLLLRISPRLNANGQRANSEIVDRIVAGSFLVLLTAQLITLAQASHLPINVSFIMSLALSAMIIYMGNYMGKLRRNFWAGIRTPWTLVNETVWERTHRFGGWLFVVTGLQGIVLSFVPSVNMWGIVTLLLLDTVLLCVYSYLIYRRVEAGGNNPVSPPFNGSM